MERVLNQMPNGGQGVKAEKVLEINPSHQIFEKIKSVYLNDKSKLSDYAEILYFAARLTSGLGVENSVSVTDKMFNLLAE